jgi:hypothetical protein
MLPGVLPPMLKVAEWMISRAGRAPGLGRLPGPAPGPLRGRLLHAESAPGLPSGGPAAGWPLPGGEGAAPLLLLLPRLAGRALELPAPPAGCGGSSGSCPGRCAASAAPLPALEAGGGGAAACADTAASLSLCCEGVGSRSAAR